jgi:hypothetical protein
VLQGGSHESALAKARRVSAMVKKHLHIGWTVQRRDGHAHMDIKHALHRARRCCGIDIAVTRQAGASAARSYFAIGLTSEVVCERHSSRGFVVQLYGGYVSR